MKLRVLEGYYVYFMINTTYMWHKSHRLLIDYGKIHSWSSVFDIILREFVSLYDLLYFTVGRGVVSVSMCNV